MEHVIGDWDSTWEFVDAGGDVVGSMRGTESARWLIEGRLVELTTQVEGQPGPSKAWMFYSDVDQLFHLVSVGANGDLWTLDGGLKEYVITSPLVERPDGSRMALRFTHDESDPNVVRAEMSRRTSEDGPWQPATRQTMRRRHSHLPSESRQFEFWVGRWDVNLRIKQPDGTWPAQSVRADAKIFSVLDGKAILELWDSQPIKGFSLRWFDSAADEWKLWLNWPGPGRSGSSGLAGTFRHGRGEFFSERGNPDGTTTTSRYTFSDITPTSLRWDDAYSTDGGATWRHQWVMEFSRTEQAPRLPLEGGPTHTYGDGTRCANPEFRRFDEIAGRRSGIVRRLEDGQWREAEAELVGHEVLGGCALIARLRTQVDGQALESLHVLTWNTFASMFEESTLDSRADSGLELYYGSSEGDRVSMVRHPVFGEEIAGRRHTWDLGESISLRVAVPDDAGGWVDVVVASFPR